MAGIASTAAAAARRATLAPLAGSDLLRLALSINHRGVEALNQQNMQRPPRIWRARESWLGENYGAATSASTPKQMRLLRSSSNAGMRRHLCARGMRLASAPLASAYNQASSPSRVKENPAIQRQWRGEYLGGCGFMPMKLSQWPLS